MYFQVKCLTLVLVFDTLEHFRCFSGYVDGRTRRKRDPYKPIDYLGMFSIGEFVGYLIRCLIAPAFVWFPDILIGLPDNLIQAIAAVWLVVMSIFVPMLVERTIDGL